MQPVTPSPDNSDDLEFRVEKFEYCSYQISNDSLDIRGILRVVVVPFRLVKMKKEEGEKPQFMMQSVNVISFVNKGRYGTPDPNPINLDEIGSQEKTDITDEFETLSDPYIVLTIINTTPHYRIRIKTSIMKVEVVKGKCDYYGNPMFLVEVQPTISYSYASADKI